MNGRWGETLSYPRVTSSRADGDVREDRRACRWEIEKNYTSMHRSRVDGRHRDGDRMLKESTGNFNFKHIECRDTTRDSSTWDVAKCGRDRDKNCKYTLAGWMKRVRTTTTCPLQPDLTLYIPQPPATPCRRTERLQTVQAMSTRSRLRPSCWMEGLSQ